MTVGIGMVHDLAGANCYKSLLHLQWPAVPLQLLMLLEITNQLA